MSRLSIICLTGPSARLRQIKRQKNLKRAFPKRKRMECFPSALRRRNIKTRQSPAIWICVCRKLGQESHMIIVKTSCLENSVFKIILIHTKTQSWPTFLDYSVLKSVFVKFCGWWRISVDGRPNCRNKAAFSNFFSVKTGLEAHLFQSVAWENGTSPSLNQFFFILPPKWWWWWWCMITK